MKITEKIGTPKNIPKGPAIAPPTIMANITPIGFKPIESPNILGPKITPSNCCNTTINISTHKPFIGLIRIVSATTGTAPINGPNHICYTNYNSKKHRIR